MMKSRSRAVALAVLIGAGALLTACTETPTTPPPPPPPPWLAAGCIESLTEIGADIYFNGTENTADNVEGFASTDGTCTGSLGLTLTLVRSPVGDQPAAVAICQSLVPGSPNAFPLTDFNYPAPADAWGCSSPPPPDPPE